MGFGLVARGSGWATAAYDAHRGALGASSHDPGLRLRWPREKQRVVIARALANDPAVILADEPTANLDSHIGHEVMRLLRGIAREQGRSVIIVSHDERIKDIADRVLWLEDGMFESISGQAVDPVCGMSVDQVSAVSAEFEGVTY